MDEHIMSFLTEVSIVHSIYTNDVYFVDIEPTFEQIFEDKLTLLDEFVGINFMYGDTSAICQSLVSKSLRIYL